MAASVQKVAAEESSPNFKSYGDVEKGTKAESVHLAVDDAPSSATTYDLAVVDLTYKVREVPLLVQCERCLHCISNGISNASCKELLVPFFDRATRIQCTRKVAGPAMWRRRWKNVIQLSNPKLLNLLPGTASEGQPTMAAYHDDASSKLT